MGKVILLESECSDERHRTADQGMERELALVSWGSRTTHGVCCCPCPTGGPGSPRLCTRHGRPARAAEVPAPSGPGGHGWAVAGCGDSRGDALPSQRGPCNARISVFGLRVCLHTPGDRDDTCHVFRLFLLPELLGSWKMAP